jgi:hypothetical protein
MLNRHILMSLIGHAQKTAQSHRVCAVGGLLSPLCCRVSFSIQRSACADGLMAWFIWRGGLLFPSYGNTLIHNQPPPKYTVAFFHLDSRRHRNVVRINVVTMTPRGSTWDQLQSPPSSSFMLFVPYASRLSTQSFILLITRNALNSVHCWLLSHTLHY